MFAHTLHDVALSVQGMSLVPSVTELLLAEFMYLQYDDSRRPVYLYINSTGVQVIVMIWRLGRRTPVSPCDLQALCSIRLPENLRYAPNDVAARLGCVTERS